jgi:hypothetical protein
VRGTWLTLWRKGELGRWRGRGLVGRMWHDPRQMDSSRLSALPILANLPAAELDQLADVLGEVEVEAGAEFIRRDAYGTAVYFIEQGEAEVRMLTVGQRSSVPVTCAVRSRSS